MARSKTHVTVLGKLELDRKLALLPAVVEAGARAAVKSEVHELAEDLRDNAPVLTGNLKAGIRERTTKKGMSGSAVSTAPHTGFVVNGTSDTAAQDFMTPAAMRSEQRFPKTVRRSIEEQLGKVTK